MTRCAAAIFVALSCAGAAAQATAAATGNGRSALIRRWESAQGKTIAAIHDPKARAAAARAFAAQRAQLDAPASPPPLNLAAAARLELRAPGRYQLSTVPAPPPRPPWWKPIWDWIVDRWNALWQAAFGRTHPSAGQMRSFGYGLMTLAGLALLYAVVRLLGGLAIERTRRAAGVEALHDDVRAAELYARALRNAAAGDYGGAAKQLFAASIAALELAHDVRDDRSATVREVRGALRTRDASLIGAFDAIARPFVASAYAERPVGGEEWEAARNAFLRLWPQAPA